MDTVKHSTPVADNMNLHLKKMTSWPQFRRKQEAPCSLLLTATGMKSVNMETLMETFTGLESVKREKPSHAQQMPPSKAPKAQGLKVLHQQISAVKKQRSVKDMYGEDSEETEENREDERR